MTEAEFIERFADRVVEIAGTHFDDGESIEIYARMVAPTYWADPDMRDDGPEECAESELSYWEADQ